MITKGLRGGVCGAGKRAELGGHRVFADTDAAVTQAVLPQFRQRRAGVIVNVTSSVTVKSLPLLSVYTASKSAINAFTESLALELEQFNVRVNLVLPGRAPTTRFGENAQPRRQNTIPEAYTDLAQNIFAAWGQPSPVTVAADVAAAIWRAATEPATPTRIAAGADAVALFTAAQT